MLYWTVGWTVLLDSPALLECPVLHDSLVLLEYLTGFPSFTRMSCSTGLSSFTGVSHWVPLFYWNVLFYWISLFYWNVLFYWISLFYWNVLFYWISLFYWNVLFYLTGFTCFTGISCSTWFSTLVLPTLSVLPDSLALLKCPVLVSHDYFFLLELSVFVVFDCPVLQEYMSSSTEGWNRLFCRNVQYLAVFLILLLLLLTWPFWGYFTNSKHWFTTSFLQPLPYLVMP